MKKCFELTPCLLAFLCITSCVEDVDNERSKGMFSASQSGFSTIEVYDLGPLNKIDLSIAKAGLEDTGGTVTFSVEQSLLDSLNNADGTSYQLLPDVYKRQGIYLQLYPVRCDGYGYLFRIHQPVCRCDVRLHLRHTGPDDTGETKNRSRHRNRSVYSHHK